MLWTPKILRPVNDERLTKFWSAVAVGTKEECWPWEGGTSGDGYGIFRWRQHYRTSSHRIAFALGKQTEPGEGHVCHSCDNPICCNPDHLFLGDPKINAQDKVSKGRARGRYSLKVPTEPSGPVPGGK